MKFLPVKTGKIIMSNNLKLDLAKILKPYEKDKIFILTDENTSRLCFTQISDIKGISASRNFTVKAGDNNKNVETLISIWDFLIKHKADRNSLLINLGGGMVCDLGGFAAATFKRGMPFINLPTTLLAQVDAATGGKTGINFLEFKNSVGMFKEAEMVVINADFLKNLDKENMKSGFAEIIKHALLMNEDVLNNVLKFNLLTADSKALNNLIAESVLIKDFYVTTDFDEKTIRKALNLGHTIGHAFETLALLNGKPVLHGYAVAYGVVVELYLSHLVFGFNNTIVHRITNYVTDNYGIFIFSETDFDLLFEIMTHDKKNRNEKISFSLLKQAGEAMVDVFCEREIIEKALRRYINQHINPKMG